MTGTSPRGRAAQATAVAVRRQCDPGTAGDRASIGQAWDRREFMGTVAATAMTALVPTVTKALTTGPATAKAGPTPLADWTIDDMFGVWPRYADPIPHGNSWPGDIGSDEPLNAL